MTRGFSIFADIFFIKHICLWSKDAYSYFPQSTAGQATAESSEIGRRGPGSALEGPEAAAARFADSRGDGVLMSSLREAAPRRRVPFLPPAPLLRPIFSIFLLIFVFSCIFVFIKSLCLI